MQIEKGSQGDLLELTVQGRLDNDSSVYFREEIEAAAREGWHRILVDLNGVTYLSSSGIAALVDAKKRMDRLSGFFGIHNASPHVEQILRLTRLLDTLRCDPQKAHRPRHERHRVGPVGGYAIRGGRRARAGDLFPRRVRAAGMPRLWQRANPCSTRMALARDPDAYRSVATPSALGSEALGGAGHPAASHAAAAQSPQRRRSARSRPTPRRPATASFWRSPEPSRSRPTRVTACPTTCWLRATSCRPPRSSTACSGRASSRC